MSKLLRLYNSWDQYSTSDLDNKDELVVLSQMHRTSSNMTHNLSKDSSKSSSQSFYSDANIKYAVEFNNVQLNYGTKKKPVQVLRGINLKVPEGAIYALLGPSGCGKTTLCNCITGRNRPTEGTVNVFGKRPCASGSNIPGPIIGYMPQEISLFPDFSIEETLLFFSQLYRLDRPRAKERVQFLVDFLELPDKTRMVANLSGGQQRRVSLAAALIHSPPLLILDEPTVGVDPVLRQVIWDYLVLLSIKENLSIIITTHYIEEARAANVCGLMRQGRLLVEESPNFLMETYKCPTLEAVFLLLSRASDNNTEPNQGPDDIVINNRAPTMKQIADRKVAQEGAVAERKAVAIEGVVNGKTMPNFEKFAIEQTPETRLGVLKQDIRHSCGRVAALTSKNAARLMRNLPVLLFQFLLPSVEVILFCLCIGQDPFNLRVSIFNQEKFMPANESYAQQFLSHISNRSIIQVPYNSSEEALHSVRVGNSWAALTLAENFTAALRYRVLLPTDDDPWNTDAATVHLHLDNSNYLIGLQLQRMIYTAFESFATNTLKAQNISTSMAKLPVHMEQPIYGVKDPTFTEFMAPGVLLSIAFLAAVALTAIALVQERKEGSLERCLVAGVSSTEFIISHIFTQLLVLHVQIFLLLIFTFLVFEIPSRGPFFWVIVLTLLQSTCGMAFGLMISALTKEETSATMLALGSFYPNLLLSGTVWPIQAMPDAMRYLAICLPQTLPIESLRYMLSRGWDISYPEVATGFAVTIGWTTFFLVSAVFIFKAKI